MIFSNCTLLLAPQIRAIYAVFSGSMAAMVCARISLTVSLHNDHYLQLSELLVQNELVHISLVLLVRAVRGILVLVVHPGEVVHGKPCPVTLFSDRQPSCKKIQAPKINWRQTDINFLTLTF